MTTALTQVWSEESGAIGLPSTEVTSTSHDNVIKVEINAPRPLPVRNAQALDSVIRKHELIPERAARMAAARQRLAESLADAGTLAELRLSMGMSQTQLAERAHTSQAHIARIEAGKNDPTTDVISKLALALGKEEGIVFQAVRKSRIEREKIDG